MEGHSPVVQYIDAEGKMGWASQSEFRVIDPRVLPPANLKNILSSLRG
jgi:hypothetical protein